MHSDNVSNMNCGLLMSQKCSIVENCDIEESAVLQYYMNTITMYGYNDACNDTDVQCSGVVD